ncbi:MAG TPA: cytochrome c oxidase assembly protein [Thermoanaerobaculia bacterium]|jgi:putative membrane protein|nr:cytochrome c oxidase assembly protein [Thermoanaerobaculia bacterium]
MPVIAFLLHAGHSHLTVPQVLRWWSWEPWVVALLVISTVLYAVGVARLWRSAGARHGITGWQAASYGAAVASLVVALISPVDTLGGILFSAHMVQHELLMLVAAPLLVLGRPFVAFVWAVPALAAMARNRPLTAAWRRLTSPLAATVLHGLALWTWHLPSLYQATLASDAVHAAQHASFLLTAALFWWSLLHGRAGRIGYGIAVVYVFFTTIHSGALGALLTFSPNLWYPIYGPTTAKWGLDALEDQQLAGLIMWIPAGVILVVLGVAMFLGWLEEAERRVAFTRSERLKQR